MLCVEMIRRFIDHNYERTSSRGPTVLYCAPSNKAVNVGACTYVSSAIIVYDRAMNCSLFMCLIYLNVMIYILPFVSHVNCIIHFGT